MTTLNQPWPDAAFEQLQSHDVRQIAYVPDAGLSRLIERCEQDATMRAVALTTEEEGIGVLAGAWLGGQRGVLLMQSSGVGNCVNLFAFAQTCRLPLLMLVTMRGQWGEFNPWQTPMGELTPEVLRSTGSRVYPVDDPSQVGETLAAAARIAFEGQLAAAVLISQRIIGTKTFGR